ncbi:hypothetical protein LGT39_04145 [Demequina sp. TTPB684]|uniref:hypothetical protein n=1 Tax=unclassified Demequina TaxID=2620311 RepID=UPI001CF20E04|nr:MULTISPECIES: hypothetical protein [unclassified Demequina]MCB2412040.1 hypothetical protein [Demequina sp. TTPB684]UPU88852.1 hypothetical protein LGT36_002735 [Demequina sp. TMPB413]
MPDAPLSRRARRAMEAQAAERAAAHDDPTLPAGQGADTRENEAAAEAERQLSRRDRRRLERLARPMESWTAEEEMIATGQIPAMTPERIAEQERLAREAAEKAAADAQTASAELRILAQRDLEGFQPGEADAAPVTEPVADAAPTPVEPTADERAGAFEPVAKAEPSDFEPAGETAPTTEPGTFEPVEEAKPAEPAAVTEEYSPRFELDGEGLAPVAPGQQAPEAPEEEPAAEATVEDRPDTTESARTSDDLNEAAAAAARAKVFEELFPPGSSQAALLEQDRLAREAQASPAENAPEDDEAEERRRGIEELRRLTEAAMSGIEKSARQEPAPGPAPEQSADAQQEPPVASRFEMPADPEGEQQFSTLGAPAPAPAPAPWEPLANAPFPVPGSLAPPSGQFPVMPPPQAPVPEGPTPVAPVTPPGGLAPHHATFDETLRASSGEVPMPPASATDAGFGNDPAPWGTHPLDAAAPSSPPEVDDFEPVNDVPRPDFSQLYNQPRQQGPATTGQNPTAAQFPSSGQFPTTGQFPASGQFPVTGEFPVTGQIRRVPDLPPVGGAKHFKWLHLAVIGALMFLLGVVIYNVAFGQ